MKRRVISFVATDNVHWCKISNVGYVNYSFNSVISIINVVGEQRKHTTLQAFCTAHNFNMYVCGYACIVSYNIMCVRASTRVLYHCKMITVNH